MLDLQGGQRLPKSPDPRVSDLGIVDHQQAQFGQAAQVRQTGIANPGVLELQHQWALDAWSSRTDSPSIIVAPVPGDQPRGYAL